MIQGNIEKLESLYLAPSPTIRIQGEKVYRIDVAGLRHYIREKNGQTYKSLTTFLSAVMPEEKPLKNWREQMTSDLGSPEKMNEWMDKTADYGTGLHISAADYCRIGYVDWLDFEHWAYNHVISLNLQPKAFDLAFRKLIKDSAGLFKFFHDYRVRVIAVEIPIFLKRGIATLGDLVVEMDEKKYDKTHEDKRKRIEAIINIKSGSAAHKPQILQLVGERRMFNETYGGNIKEVFTLHPVDWRETPNYDLKRHTETIERKRYEALFDSYLNTGEIDGILGEPSKNFPRFSGVTKYGEDPTNALTLRSYNEFAQERISTYEKELTKDSTII